jgi:hypothetical protein
MRTAAFLAAVVVCALAVIPAGGSRTPLTVTAYRDKANLICTNERGKTMRLVIGIAHLERYLTAQIAVVRSAHDSLEQLAPPAKFASVHSEIVSLLGSEVTYFATLRDQAKAGKLTVPEFQANSRLGVFDGRELALWKKTGAQTCATP